MEESVWIAIGIISILIVFGIIAGFFKGSGEEDKLAYAKESANLLGGMCNKVCLMPDQTNLYIDANIPSGSALNVYNNSICMEIKGEVFCSRCQCLMNNYALDLNSPEAIKLFKIHKYKCFFLNSNKRISVDCRG